MSVQWLHRRRILFGENRGCYLPRMCKFNKLRVKLTVTITFLVIIITFLVIIIIIA